ncbi:hypothetical protein LCGC14_1333110 [marine sediment metagenome]|uniref:Uncharacterized protein n=1 Tax=marine sediment metagenome TaxID=412755 RepID=A0A0F9L1Y8_9ZZZZ
MMVVFAALIWLAVTSGLVWFVMLLSCAEMDHPKLTWRDRWWRFGWSALGGLVCAVAATAAYGIHP